MTTKFYILSIVISYCLISIKVIRGATNLEQYSNQMLSNLSRLDEIYKSRFGYHVSTINPTEVNTTDLYSGPNQNINSLFKLNTEVIFNGEDFEAKVNTIDEFEPNNEQDFPSRGKSRESRKINFLRGLWNKPKVSPLYLVNGTVCRFVNTTPICTTLTTTGLLPTSSSNPSTSSQSEGGTQAVRFPFNNNNNNNNNQQQQQFVNNNQLPPRPLPIIDDDSQDIIVESNSNFNATDNSTITNPTTVSVLRQQQTQQQTNRPIGTSQVTQGSSRPINLVSNRRPMNLLSLRRPVQRQFYLNGGRAS